jgi:hypothetical protein
MSLRAWVSPEAADETRCDTESKTVSDDHGNGIELDRLTRGDSKNRILKWVQSLFGA